MDYKFTLDMNCLIDLDEKRPSGADIRRIIQANDDGRVQAFTLAIGASERQKDHGYLDTANDYYARLKKLGVDHLKVLMPMLYLDMTFLNNALLCDAAMMKMENDIHNVLFPDVEIFYEAYCAGRGITQALPIDRAWRNAKCDVQAMWCHLHHRCNVFVTSDQNFLKKSAALQSLGAGFVLAPAGAAALLDANQAMIN